MNSILHKNSRCDTITSMKTIDHDIKTGKLKQAYLLYGQERYLLRQYRDKLKNAIIDAEDTMNFSVFEGRDIDEKEVISIADTLPFFAERRLILMENSGWFRKASEEMLKYISNVPQSTYFLFVEEEIDKRSKFYKAFAKIGSAVEFQVQKDEILARWVGSRIRREGKGMTQAAYDLFISKTGQDMENIDKELEKLVCYTMDKDMIEVSDVEQITTEQIQNKIFEMVDAITSHRQKLAMELYYDLLAQREPPMRIMYLVTRQFQMLMNVKAMSNQGFGNKEIAAKVSCQEWLVRKYLGQCRNYSVDKLKKIIQDGVHYEEAVKTGHMNDQIAVELFIVRYSK